MRPRSARPARSHNARPARSHSARPARRFALRTLGVLALVGVAVHAMLVQAVDDELDRQLRFRAEFVATYLLAPLAVDGRLDDTTVGEVVAEDPQVTEVTVRDALGAAVGRAGARDATDVVAEVPLPGTEGLVASVAQDDAVVQAAATDLTRRLTLVLGGALVLLWLAIVPLAHRLGRDLRRQADELRAQGEELRTQSVELRRLLDREQVTVRRLQEVDELRERFLESVSHELRTPLTVVRGALQTLARHGDAVPPEVRADLLERAAAKAGRLDELVLGLLEMNRSLEPATDTEVVAVEEAVLAALTQLPPRDVELDLEVEDLVTSPARLERTLGHLIGNAIRHAPGDDRVVVRTLVVDDGVELQVEDHGPGVPDGLKHAVFDPFRQGDLHDAHSPGIGMGLSVVARHAAEHGGRAWITDTPGGGCRVHVLFRGVLPHDDADRPGAGPPPGAATPAGPGLATTAGGRQRWG